MFHSCVRHNGKTRENGEQITDGKEVEMLYGAYSSLK